MSEMPPKKQICVLTVGMDSRKLAIFRMAFKMHAIQTYLLAEDAPEMKPDLAIVDMDSAYSKQLWDHHCSEYQELPTLVVSVSAVPDATVPVLQKPIRMESLFSMLRQVLSDKPLPKLASGKIEEVGTTVAAVELKAEVPAVKMTPPVEKAEPKAPPVPSVAIQRPSPPREMPEEIERFNPGLGILGALQEALNSRIPSLVSIGERKSLAVFPDQQQVVVLQSLEAVHLACSQENASVSTRPLKMEESFDGDFEKSNVVSLLWQVALWTSRGRLPEGISVNSPVRLKYWPNMTRMAPIPNAMRVAALLARSPARLQTALRMLNVTPADLFDFVSATYAIGHLEIMEAAGERVEIQPQLQKSEKGGLLSRILRRIVGK